MNMSTAIKSADGMAQIEKSRSLPSLKELLSKERLQYLVFIALCAEIVGLTGVAYSSDSLFFQRFFGVLNPLIPVVLVGFLGFASLSFLLSRGWFAIFETANLRGMFYLSGLAALFASITISADLNGPLFPADLNILFPRSLLFYPVIGFGVEILEHTLPLSLILIVVTSLSKTVNRDKVIWIGIFTVSFVEPVIQTVSGISGALSPWTAAFLGTHLYLFNMSQLIVFKRYDFVSMYSFRIVYYMLWHVVWGYARLILLFQ